MLLGNTTCTEHVHLEQRILNGKNPFRCVKQMITVLVQKDLYDFPFIYETNVYIRLRDKKFQILKKATAYTNNVVAFVIQISSLLLERAENNHVWEVMCR